MHVMHSSHAQGGKLTKREFRLAASEIGMQMDSALINELFDACMADHSGRIDLREMMELLHSRGQLKMKATRHQMPQKHGHGLDAAS